MKPTRYPKITIITPSLNKGKYIEKAIKSVLGQKYPNTEYIIVDQGSKDETTKVIKKYASKIIFIHQKSKGISKALNAALNKATGDIMGWLNADDYYLPHSLQKVCEFFTHHPKASWLAGDYVIVDEYGNKIRSFIVYWKKLLRMFSSKYALLFGNYIAQPSTFWRKAVFKKIGRMNPKLTFNMDLDYWLRIFKYFKLHTMNDRLSAFRVHPSSLTYKYHKRSFEEQIKVLKKHFPNVLSISIAKFFNYFYTFLYSILKKTYENKVSDIPERIDAIAEKRLKRHKKLHLKRYIFVASYIKNFAWRKIKILDAGCGFGYGSKIINDKIPSAKIMSIDKSDKTIAYAIKRYKKRNIQFKIGNIEKLSFADNTFDYIVCFETIEHVSLNDASLAIKEFYRTLKKDGILLISSPNGIYTKFLKVFFDFQNPHHLHEFLPKELEGVLRNGGFEILERLTQGFLFTYPSSVLPQTTGEHFLFVAKKSKAP